MCSARRGCCHSRIAPADDRLLERYRADLGRLLCLGRMTGAQAALLDEYATTLIGRLEVT